MGEGAAAKNATRSVLDILERHDSWTSDGGRPRASLGALYLAPGDGSDRGIQRMESVAQGMVVGGVRRQVPDSLMW